MAAHEITTGCSLTQGAGLDPTLAQLGSLRGQTQGWGGTARGVKLAGKRRARPITGSAEEPDRSGDRRDDQLDQPGDGLNMRAPYQRPGPFLASGWARSARLRPPESFLVHDVGQWGAVSPAVALKVRRGRQRGDRAQA